MYFDYSSSIQGTFTGFLRVFTDDKIFNKDEPESLNNHRSVVYNTSCAAASRSLVGITSNLLYLNSTSVYYWWSWWV
jgi:hypothetical protein